MKFEKEILEILPHRYPFVMVDRILDYEEKKYTLNQPARISSGAAHGHLYFRLF